METVGDPAPTRPDSLLDDRSDEQPLKRANSLVVMAGLAIVLTIIWVAFFERSASDQKQAMEVRDAMLAVALEQYTVRVLKTAQAVNQYVSRGVHSDWTTSLRTAVSGGALRVGWEESGISCRGICSRLRYSEASIIARCWSAATCSGVAW